MREFYGPPIRRFLGFHFGQEFVEQKTCVVVTEAVVFVAAIETIERCIGVGGLYHARRNKHADDDRQFFSLNQIVKDSGRFKVKAVLLHINAGRLVRFVLRRHINPIVPHRAGKNLTGPGVLFQRAFRHISVPLRIGAKLVFFSRKLRREQNQNGQNDRSHGFHRDYPPREPNILTRGMD